MCSCVSVSECMLHGDVVLTKNSYALTTGGEFPAALLAGHAGAHACHTGPSTDQRHFALL